MLVASTWLFNPTSIEVKQQRLTIQPVPVAVRSKVCSRPLAGSAGSKPTGGMKHCVLSGRGLCDWPIPRLEESYRVCVSSLSVIKANKNPHGYNEKVVMNKTERKKTSYTPTRITCFHGVHNDNLITSSSSNCNDSTGRPINMKKARLGRESTATQCSLMRDIENEARCSAIWCETSKMKHGAVQFDERHRKWSTAQCSLMRDIENEARRSAVWLETSKMKHDAVQFDERLRKWSTTQGSLMPDIENEANL